MSRLLHLDPSLPVVWRSPESLQIGVDPPQALIDSLDQRFLPVLAALQSGISEEGCEAIASHEGLTPEETERLSPRPQSGPHPSSPRPICRGSPSPGQPHTLATFARVLWDVGYRDDKPADDAILVASFVMPASAYHPWLADDVPHTPVIFSDQAIIVGPRVTPGDGPCLQCVWENRAEAEPALVALATQLSTRSAATDTRPSTLSLPGTLAVFCAPRLPGSPIASTATPER
jgi:hypothetical protein